MDREIKIEARKQYFRYFRIWFILIGILAVVFFGLFAVKMWGGAGKRQNQSAPAERVYDNADVLTDTEEQKLRDYIAKSEKKYGMDIVLVTINEDVESQGDWETVMCSIAEDFYDDNQYGYNRISGDGVLLLDNWYEDENGSQKGSWLSACGKLEYRLDDYDIETVYDEVYRYVDEEPYKAYKAYVTSVCEIVSGDEMMTVKVPWTGVLVLPVVVGVVFALINLRNPPAKDTTAPNAYVSGGRPVMKNRRDDFIRKDLITRRIQNDNHSSGSRSRGHSGGVRRSSGGVRHGGGGRRR